MKGYRYVITNPEGLHARIAVNLAKICRDEVTVTNDGTYYRGLH